VNGWLSALKWERFWGVKAGGSHSTEALASVTTALRYYSRHTVARLTAARESIRPQVQVSLDSTSSLVYYIHAPNHLGVNPDSPDGTRDDRRVDLCLRCGTRRWLILDMGTTVTELLS
jgi:hypothetical protein